MTNPWCPWYPVHSEELLGIPIPSRLLKVIRDQVQGNQTIPGCHDTDSIDMFGLDEPDAAGIW
jgi:hypothetical protein